MASASIFMSSADSPDCAPCKIQGKENEATWHCGTCREYMCQECHGVHSRLRMTKDHVTNILVPELVQGPDDTKSGSNVGTFDLQGEVSGRRQHSDGIQQIRATYPDWNQKKSDTNFHGQVSGRVNSDESRKGNIWTDEGKLATCVQDMHLDAAPGTGRPLSGQPRDGRSNSLMSKLHTLLKGGKQSRDGKKHDSKQVSYDQVSGRVDTSETIKTSSKMTGHVQDSRKQAARSEQVSYDQVSGRVDTNERNKTSSTMTGQVQASRKQAADVKQVSYEHVSGRVDTSEINKTSSKMTEQVQTSRKLAADVKHVRWNVTPGTSRSSSGVPSSSYHPVNSSAVLMNQFDASHEGDNKSCWITSALLLGDLITIADLNNHTIKVFNKRDFHFIFRRYVEEPFDLTEISGAIIAVTSSMKKYFTLFSLKDSGLNEIRRVKTPYSCYGICHHGGFIYVVCKKKATGAAEIDVFTCDGEMKRRLQPIHQGKKVLQSPVYITVSHETGTLFVGDWNADSVVRLSISGKVLSYQKVKKCETTGGVAVDDRGQLYVCGFNTHNIIGMSPDGMKSEISILKKDIRFPQCLHMRGNELILGCMKTNIVRIYRLL